MNSDTNQNAQNFGQAHINSIMSGAVFLRVLKA